MNLRLVGDPPAFGHPPRMFDIRHQDVNRLLVDVALKFSSTEERFTAGSYLARMSRDMCIGLDLIAWNGFLEPEQIEGLYGLCNTQSQRQVKSTVAIDEQIDVTTDRLPGCP